MGFAARLQEAKTHEDAQKGPVSASVASDVITAALSKAVISNGLAALYPLGGPRLAKILAQLGETFNMAAFCQRFRIPPLIAGDLMQVALYDVQLFIDDSGSMNESDKWDDARAIVNQIVQITTQFDLDGIDVEFMNSPISGKRLKTSEEVTALFDQVWRLLFLTSACAVPVIDTRVQFCDVDLLHGPFDVLFEASLPSWPAFGAPLVKVVSLLCRFDRAASRHSPRLATERSFVPSLSGLRSCLPVRSRA